MPLILIVSAFAALVGNGGAPRASIALGKGEKDEAEKILGTCFSMQILISLVLTAVLLLWNRNFLLAFGASENTIEYGVSYMNIYSVGTIFVQLTLGMNFFITAQGFAKTGMLSVLIGAISNIVLDPVLIFGFHMGVKGAALATIISQGLSCIWVLSFLFGKKTTLRIRRENMKLKRERVLPTLALGSSVFVMQSSESIIAICFNASLLKYGGDIAVGAMTILTRRVLPTLALGSSVFVMQSSESIIAICFNASLLKYGGDIAVGAMTILTSVMQFAMLPLQGLGQGAQPIISYNYGAGKKDRVKGAFKLLLKSSMLYAALLWIAVWKKRPCQRCFQAAFKIKYALCSPSLDCSYAVSTAFCRNVYLRSGPSCFYKNSVADLSGSNVYLWNSDGMPAYVYVPWKCKRNSDGMPAYVYVPWKCKSIYCGSGYA